MLPFCGSPWGVCDSCWWFVVAFLDPPFSVEGWRGISGSIEHEYVIPRVLILMMNSCVGVMLSFVT